MLLRRVIVHVRKQEWTAIWIDLVIELNQNAARELPAKLPSETAP
jgi:hypothetical protein